MEPLAHSARQGCPEQTYREHVGHVFGDARTFAQSVAGFSKSQGANLVAAVELAAAYHDLGKLDPLFQDDLQQNHRKTRINHVDAGAAHMTTGKPRQEESAMLIYAHHLGLPDLQKEHGEKDNNGVIGRFRDWSENDHLRTAEFDCVKVFEHVDRSLSNYLDEHHRLLPAVNQSAKPGFSGLMRRLGLSCLVDADHGDTARHYGKEFEVNGAPLLPAERLQALNEYVATLDESNDPSSERQRERQELRQSLYVACRDRVLESNETLVACESPVGTGKTTAVMAHLLNLAAKCGLRRVFVVLPFTNIINQSVEVYRKALVLPGENPEEIVAAHHHRVEFDGENAMGLRLLTQRWAAPIIVTTAVQFFETLSACNTAALRKLHQVPGSCLFIDETHAAMPAPQWPQMFRWLAELGKEWSCHTVFASGSLARFWTMPEFFPQGAPGKVVELVESAKLRERARQLEARRVSLLSYRTPLSIDKIADLLLAKRGPRLIIFNTVQSAAVFADYLANQRRVNVEHLSTSLTPLDRAATVTRVGRRLKNTDDHDWCLVATSCVESGVDFSFRTAFRESCGLVNLIQIAGRVNRHEEHAEEEPEVWDFRHDERNYLNPHPQFKLSRRVLADMFDKGLVVPDSVACSEALRRELSGDYGEGEATADAVRKAEDQGQYPEVAKLCRLINQDTRTVIVSPELIKNLESLHPSKYPPMKEIMEHSVQLWANRLDAGKWPVKPIGDGSELWGWVGKYTSILGYMAGVLPLMRAGKCGIDDL